MSKKTILFTNVGADLYGADYVLLCLVKSLNQEKYRSIVIVPFHGPLVVELEAAGACVFVSEFPVLRRRVFSIFGLAMFAWQMLGSLIYLLALVQREKVDIFHTNTASIWAPGITATFMRKPHIWQVMELVESPRVVGWAMAKMTGIFSSKVFCISDAVRRHFLRDNPGRSAKFQTLYHGVNLEEYSPARYDRMAMKEKLGIPATSPVVMYAGRFSSWKGQDVFAHAIQILDRSGAMTRHLMHFIVLGSCFPGQEEFERALDTELETISDQQCIHRAGFQRNLPEWMAASDIFVLPSKRPEPNATVLIGAMAMGLACVGTNIGGTPETIIDGTTGILIAPDSPAALAEAVIHLVQDPELRAGYGAEGKQRARTIFSMKHYCKTIEECYE